MRQSVYVTTAWEWTGVRSTIMGESGCPSNRHPYILFRPSTELSTPRAKQIGPSAAQQNMTRAKKRESRLTKHSPQGRMSRGCGRGAVKALKREYVQLMRGNKPQDRTRDPEHVGHRTSCARAGARGDADFSVRKAEKGGTAPRRPRACLVATDGHREGYWKRRIGLLHHEKLPTEGGPDR